jgi:GntR family transcriptional regulator / MocR family aminotransferase
MAQWPDHFLPPSETTWAMDRQNPGMAGSRLWLQQVDWAHAPGQTRREQLCHALRTAARMQGEALKLPSTRQLAIDLRLSRVTVEAAYAQLEAEGLIERRHGSGSYWRPQAAPLPRLQGTLAVPAVLSKRGRSLVEVGGCEDPLVPRAFAAGSPDLRAFPWAIWRRLSRQRAADAEALGRYQPPQGNPRLRAVLAAHLASSRGVKASADQLLMLTSSQQGLFLLGQLLLDPGDTVWMEDPGYPGARAAFAAAGARVVPVPVDPDGLAPSAALPSPKLIYVTPAHQYPLGVRMTPARRAQLLALSRQHGSWIVEDDYDSEFHALSAALPALQSQDAEGRVIYLGTFSKTLMPSLRLAYAVLPTGLVHAAVQLRSLVDGHGNGWFQTLVADFVEAGHYAAHLRHQRQLVAARRGALLHAVQRQLPWARAYCPEACGLQLCVSLPAGAEPRLTRQAALAGVLTPSLSRLSITRPLDGWLLGFAALTPPEIDEAVRRLGTLSPGRRRAGG